jgi:predicted adenine nucleotide alpha hydrolase (AANH) superfamily ATPase
VLEYLSRYFSITLLFYNPNISPRNEYDLRLEELYRLTKDMGLSEDVSFVECDYEPERFYEIAKGLESLPEGGERCKKCYELRLSKSAQVAARLGFDYFTTTLSISPYKNAEWLNEIGKAQGELYGIKYLFSDFKKRNGYKRSCELSQKYGLYRQDYCGCIYSKVERDKQNGK